MVQAVLVTFIRKDVYEANGLSRNLICIMGKDRIEYKCGNNHVRLCTDEGGV